MSESKPFTHTAWLFATETVRRGRRIGRWHQEGAARVEPNGDVNIYLHSTPIGGNLKHIYLSKIGNKAPDGTEPAPSGEDGDEGDEGGEDEEDNT
jgi:hypothetical protein